MPLSSITLWQVETVLFASPSSLVGWVSRTREGGKNDPAGLVRRARVFEKSGGRPITGATYKHVWHVKLAAYTLAPTGSCSSPMLTRHGTHNIAEVRDTHRGARAHDHTVKSFALYRLS